MGIFLVNKTICKSGKNSNVLDISYTKSDPEITLDRLWRYGNFKKK